MKIYIATPVNARKEATLEEKRKAAWRRIAKLIERVWCEEDELQEHIDCHSSFDDDIAPLSKPIELLPESVVIGRCVTRVMECDVILMDWGYENSKGCTVEHTTALVYGKKIIHAYDLDIEPESLLTKYGVEPKKESQPIEQAEEWKPAESIDEAAAIVRAHPITKNMTYEERLAAQKARFGL